MTLGPGKASAACHSRRAREVASHCPDWRGVLTEFRFLKGAELCDDEADGIAQPSAVKPNRWKANNDS